MSRVGTLAWTEERGGLLRPQDRLRLLGQGIAFTLSQLPWTVTGPLGLRPRTRTSLDLERVRIPDTPAAKEAEQLCDQMRPRMLIGHCYRTYLWANVLAAGRGESFDEEVLYVSSLLHDLGLSEDRRGSDPPCFTLIGAEAAKRLKGTPAAEPITLHINLRHSGESTEARLMAAATQLDVIGAYYWKIDPATIDAVLARHPRDGVKDGMLDAFRWQSRHNPGTRVRFYWRYLGFPLLIRLAPFDD